MNVNMNFSKWLLEYANYGFEKDSTKNKTTKNMQGNDNDSLPWTMFGVEEFFEELKGLVEADNKRTSKVWHEELGWEDNGSIVEVNINPFGSLRITTRKQIKDLKGETTRICKHVFDIDDYHTNQEKILAHHIYEKVEEFNKENADFASANYTGLKKLARDLFTAVRAKYPDYIMFPVKMMEMNSDYYKMVFEFRGSGQGVPGSSIAMQFDIDLAYDREKGLIKCWGYDIDSPVLKRQLNIQPSEWNEYFSPQEQSRKIIGMIVTTFMTY